MPELIYIIGFIVLWIVGFVAGWKIGGRTSIVQTDNFNYELSKDEYKRHVEQKERFNARSAAVKIVSVISVAICIPTTLLVVLWNVYSTPLSEAELIRRHEEDLVDKKAAVISDALRKIAENDGWMEPEEKRKYAASVLDSLKLDNFYPTTQPSK